MITRSRTLRGDKDIDSRVEVIGSIKQEESNINVGVTNRDVMDISKMSLLTPIQSIYIINTKIMEEKFLSEYILIYLEYEEKSVIKSIKSRQLTI